MPTGKKSSSRPGHDGTSCLLLGLLIFGRRLRVAGTVVDHRRQDRHQSPEPVPAPAAAHGRPAAEAAAIRKSFRPQHNSFTILRLMSFDVTRPDAAAGQFGLNNWNRLRLHAGPVG